MTNNNLLLILLFLIIFSSCSSKKKIYYLQDSDNYESLNLTYDDYKVDIDDILKIDIKSSDPELELIFSSTNLNSSLTNRDSYLLNGYQIDTDGMIDLPQVGKIYVKGMSLKDIKSTIIDTITKNEILNNPFIDIKLLNSHFTILGEVNMPGKYVYDQNNLNVFEAIGIAGDLTINGKRADVKVIREKNGKKNIFTVDLTSVNFMNSKYYQIFSKDIIIISPNTNRVKNAGIIGNSGTLLSLLSFILSSIIVINN